MSSSGLVIVILVALWGAYLIPTWLRRHDIADEIRSIDRFSRAMRVLSRRGSAPDRRYLAVASRLHSVDRDERVVAARRASALVRRRRVTGVAVAVVVAALVLAVLGMVSWLAVGGGALLLLAYVVHLRTQARVAAERARRAARRRAAAARRADSARASVPAAAPHAPRVLAAVHADLPVSGALALEARPDREWADAAAPPAVAFEEDPLQAVLDLPVEQAWEPVPVPLPTYVSAPKAVRPARIIDLTRPGAWTEGRAVDEPVPVVGPDDVVRTIDGSTIDEPADDEVVEPVRKLAVND